MREDHTYRSANGVLHGSSGGVNVVHDGELWPMQRTTLRQPVQDVSRAND